MRRRTTIAVTVVVAASLLAVPGASPREAAPARDAARGIVLRGLAPHPSCPGALRVGATRFCSPGPDAAPPGVDVRDPATAGPYRTAGSDDAPFVHGPPEGSPAPAPAAVPGCDGDGASGLRVQALYARADGSASRLEELRQDITDWAANVDTAVEDSAARTGGERRVRWVHDAECKLDITEAVVTPAAMVSFETMILELENLGFDRDDRKYLIWADDTVYCGIATVWIDDVPSPTNTSNEATGYGRVDESCWGLSSSVEAHELVHMLGAVQNSAPHSTSAHPGSLGGHCTDEYDRMCYEDAPGVPLTFPCPAAGEKLLDCNNDDYFSTDPAPDNYLYSHWNAADSSWLVRADGLPGRFVPLTPARVHDTRDAGVPLGPGGQVDVQVTGVGGVPASGAAAVALNVTATGTTAASHLTVWPAGSPRPLASNLNWTAGVTVPNLVVAKVGRDGKVSAYNASGSAHVVVDVAGWFWSSAPGAPGRLQPMEPSRVLDTRPDGALAPGAERVLDLSGDVAADAAGVVLNVTVTSPTASGYLTVWPDGEERPLASNLNFVAGQTVPNRVMVKLGAGRKVRIYNSAGSTHVIADANAWISDADYLGGFVGSLDPLQPARIFDTRDSGDPLGPDASVPVQVAGVGEVPSDASAVALNVTATGPTAAGYLTVWPSGSDRPTVSDLNFVEGLTVPNLVVVKVGDSGRVGVYNAFGSVHVVIDVVGWYL